MRKPQDLSPQDVLYQQAIVAYGHEIARFMTGYERDPIKRQDLLQDVQLAIWRSMSGFKAQCSLRTWVYRVVHNVGSSHVQHSIRCSDKNFTDLSDIELHADESTDVTASDRQLDFARVMALIHSLAAMDRQLMLLYLEGLDAASISDITGLSARNVATKICRIKQLLTVSFTDRGIQDE